jgi:hypothetical protein
VLRRLATLCRGPTIRPLVRLQHETLTQLVLRTFISSPVRRKKAAVRGSERRILSRLAIRCLRGEQTSPDAVHHHVAVPFEQTHQPLDLGRAPRSAQVWRTGPSDPARRRTGPRPVELSRPAPTPCGRDRPGSAGQPTPSFDERGSARAATALRGTAHDGRPRAARSTCGTPRAATDVSAPSPGCWRPRRRSSHRRLRWGAPTRTGRAPVSTGSRAVRPVSAATIRRPTAAEISLDSTSSPSAGEHVTERSDVALHPLASRDEHDLRVTRQREPGFGSDEGVGAATIEARSLARCSKW